MDDSTSDSGNLWRRSWMRHQGLLMHFAIVCMWDWFQSSPSVQDSDLVKLVKNPVKRSSNSETSLVRPRGIHSVPTQREAVKIIRDDTPLTSGLGLLLCESKNVEDIGSLPQADRAGNERKVLVLHNTVGVANNVLDVVKCGSNSSVPTARHTPWMASQAPGGRQSQVTARNILTPLRSTIDSVAELQPSSIRSDDRFSVNDSGANTPVSRSSSVISIESSFTTESSTVQLVREGLLDSLRLQKRSFTSVMAFEDSESSRLLEGEFGWRGDCPAEAVTLDTNGSRTPSEDGTGVEQMKAMSNDSDEDQIQGNLREGKNTLQQLGGRDDLLRELKSNCTPLLHDEERDEDRSVGLTVPWEGDGVLDEESMGSGGRAAQTAESHRGSTSGDTIVCDLDVIVLLDDVSCREASVGEEGEGKSARKLGEIYHKRFSGDMMLQEKVVCCLNVSVLSDGDRSPDDQDMDGIKDDGEASRLCQCTNNSCTMCKGDVVSEVLGVTSVKGDSRVLDDGCNKGKEDGRDIGMLDCPPNHLEILGEKASGLVFNGLGNLAPLENGEPRDHQNRLLSDHDDQCQVETTAGLGNLVGNDGECSYDAGEPRDHQNRLLSDNDDQCQVETAGLGNLVGNEGECSYDAEDKRTMQLSTLCSSDESTCEDPFEVREGRLCIDTGDVMKETDCSPKNTNLEEVLMGLVEGADEGAEEGGEDVSHAGSSCGKEVDIMSTELGNCSMPPEKMEQCLRRTVNAVEQTLAHADELSIDVPCLRNVEDLTCSKCDSSNRASAIIHVEDVRGSSEAREDGRTSPPLSLSTVSLPGKESQVVEKSTSADLLGKEKLPGEGSQVVEESSFADLSGKEQFLMASHAGAPYNLDLNASGEVNSKSPGRTLDCLPPADSAVVDPLPLPPPTQTLPVSCCTGLMMLGECGHLAPSEDERQDKGVVGTIEWTQVPVKEGSSSFATYCTVVSPFVIQPSLSASSPNTLFHARSVSDASLLQTSNQGLIQTLDGGGDEIWSNLPIDEDNGRESCTVTLQQRGTSPPHESLPPCQGQFQTAATGVFSTECLGSREPVDAPPEVPCFDVSSGESEFGVGVLAEEGECDWRCDKCGDPVEKPCVSYSSVMDQQWKAGARCARRMASERAAYIERCREYTDNLFKQLVSQHLHQYSRTIPPFTSPSSVPQWPNLRKCDISSFTSEAYVRMEDSIVPLASVDVFPQIKFAATEPERVQKQGMALGPSAVSTGSGRLSDELCQSLQRSEPALDFRAPLFTPHGDLLEVNEKASMSAESTSRSLAFKQADAVNKCLLVKQDVEGQGVASTVCTVHIQRPYKDDVGLGDSVVGGQSTLGGDLHLVLDAAGSLSARAGQVEERDIGGSKGLHGRLQLADSSKGKIVKNLGALMVMLVAMVLYTRMICKGAVAWAKDHPRRNGQCKEQPRSSEESV